MSSEQLPDRGCPYTEGMAQPSLAGHWGTRVRRRNWRPGKVSAISHDRAGGFEWRASWIGRQFGPEVKAATSRRTPKLPGRGRWLGMLRMAAPVAPSRGEQD